MHSTHNKGKSIVAERFIRTLNLFSGWAFLRLLTDGGRQSGSPLSKIGQTYSTMMKLGTVIPDIQKIQKIYKSRDIPHAFCLHQQFFSGNQQLLLYQEIQIQIAF